VVGFATYAATRRQCKSFFFLVGKEAMTDAACECDDVGGCMRASVRACVDNVADRFKSKGISWTCC